MVQVYVSHACSIFFGSIGDGHPIGRYNDMWEKMVKIPFMHW
jgi:hypothetical protein